MSAQTPDAGHAHTAISAKGQVTLPQSVRRGLQLHDGDDLLVTVEDGRVVLTSGADPARPAMVLDRAVAVR